MCGLVDTIWRVRVHAVELGKVQVHHHDVGLQGEGELDRLHTGCRLPDDLGTRNRREQRAETIAEDRMVLGNDHANRFRPLTPHPASLHSSVTVHVGVSRCHGTGVPSSREI